MQHILCHRWSVNQIIQFGVCLFFINNIIFHSFEAWNCNSGFKWMKNTQKQFSSTSVKILFRYIILKTNSYQSCNSLWYTTRMTLFIIVHFSQAARNFNMCEAWRRDSVGIEIWLRIRAVGVLRSGPVGVRHVHLRPAVIYRRQTLPGMSVFWQG